MYSLGQVVGAVKNPVGRNAAKGSAAANTLPGRYSRKITAHSPPGKWKWVGAAIGGILGAFIFGVVSVPIFGILAVPGFIFGVHYGGKVGRAFDVVEALGGE
jgi:uncharacterized protein YqgC (DUF456 family)